MLGAAVGFGSVASIENVTGGIGDDVLIGDAANNLIDCGAGSDIILGLTGNDTLIGDDSRDLLRRGSAINKPAR